MLTLSGARQRQDSERRRLVELRDALRASVAIYKESVSDHYQENLEVCEVDGKNVFVSSLDSRSRRLTQATVCTSCKATRSTVASELVSC